MRQYILMLALVTLIPAFVAVPGAQAHHSANAYDGVWQFNSKWQSRHCGRQSIRVTVKNGRFSFRDSGNYRWAGRVSKNGWVRITSKPSGRPVRGKFQMPRKKGFFSARTGVLLWDVCGVGQFRVWRRS